MSGTRQFQRKQKRPKSLKGYWVKGLAREDDEKLPLSEAELVEMRIGVATSYNVDNILFVSVPPTTTESARDLLKSALEARTQREVMIITHNVEVITLEEMSQKDLGKLLRHSHQDGVVDPTPRIVVPH